MVENYTQRRDQSDGMPIMEFHRKRLLLFLNRFRQLLGHFKTPSSSLLSYDLFLVIEAVTIVAKSDWTKCGSAEAGGDVSFSEYFKEFDKLASGLDPLMNKRRDAYQLLRLPLTIRVSALRADDHPRLTSRPDFGH